MQYIATHSHMVSIYTYWRSTNTHLLFLIMSESRDLEEKNISTYSERLLVEQSWQLMVEESTGEMGLRWEREVCTWGRGEVRGEEIQAYYGCSKLEIALFTAHSESLPDNSWDTFLKKNEAMNTGGEKEEEEVEEVYISYIFLPHCLQALCLGASPVLFLFLNSSAGSVM